MRTVLIRSGIRHCNICSVNTVPASVISEYRDQREIPWTKEVIRNLKRSFRSVTLNTDQVRKAFSSSIALCGLKP